MKKFLSAVMIGVLSISTAFAEGSLKVNAGNGAMNTAIDQARATLPIFLRNAVGADGESIPQASVKVGFDTNRANVGREYLWVGPFTSDGHGNFTGFLNNEPESINDLHEGETVNFKLHDIVDWSVWLEDRSYGEYTTRVLMQSMDVGEAVATLADLSDNLLPASWN